MITVVTYYAMSPMLNIGRFGDASQTVQPWDVIKRCLEHTDDTVIFVLGPNQLPAFQTDLKKWGLENYLVVDHRSHGNIIRGATNRNYPDKQRLKLFVFQGAKNAKDSSRV